MNREELARLCSKEHPGVFESDAINVIDALNSLGYAIIKTDEIERLRKEVEDLEEQLDMAGERLMGEDI